MTNPVDGREDEFKAWYTNVHLRELVGVPGFISAQRFMLSDEQLGEPSEYHYLAIYEIEAESAGAPLEALKAARPTLNYGDALDPKRVMLAYDQISEKVTSSRRLRAW